MSYSSPRIVRLDQIIEETIRKFKKKESTVAAHKSAIFTVAGLIIAPFISYEARAGVHSGIREIFSGPSSYETCAVMADRRAHCWDSSPGDAPLYAIGKDIQSMALGDAFRCALTRDGKVDCWGSNAFGELGDGTTEYRPTLPKPVQFEGSDFDRVTAISAGDSHACALRDGSAWCWGANDSVQIGNSTIPATQNALTPTPVVVTSPMGTEQLSGLRTISAGQRHTCALLANNSGACWGNDYFGQLANARSHTNFNSPQTVFVDSGGLQALVMGGGFISSGGEHTCALVTDEIANSVACWGNNKSGQIGVNADYGIVPTAFPAQDENGKITNAIDVGSGGQATCAILTDTTIRCWGSDDSSQLGIGAGGANQKSGVVLLASSRGDAFRFAVQIAAGLNHFCARTMYDNVYCWGADGIGGKTDTPTKIAIDAPLFTDNFQGD